MELPDRKLFWPSQLLRPDLYSTDEDSNETFLEKSLTGGWFKHERLAILRTAWIRLGFKQFTGSSYDLFLRLTKYYKNNILFNVMNDLDTNA